MNTVLNIGSIVFLVIIGGIIAHAVYAYKTNATDKGLARVWATSRDSATWFWAKVGLVLSWISIHLDNIATALGDPSLGDTLSKIGANPKTVGWVLLVASGTALAARIRTL